MCPTKFCGKTTKAAFIFVVSVCCVCADVRRTENIIFRVIGSRSSLEAVVNCDEEAAIRKVKLSVWLDRYLLSCKTSVVKFTTNW